MVVTEPVDVTIDSSLVPVVDFGRFQKLIHTFMLTIDLSNFTSYRPILEIKLNRHCGATPFPFGKLPQQAFG